MADKVYIYALVDPRYNDIRYVGKSLKPQLRLKQHINEKACNRGKISWIEDLKKSELVPEMRILETCDERNWDERERWWIKYGRENGWELLNLTEGGESVCFVKNPPIWLDVLPADLKQAFLDCPKHEQAEMTIAIAEMISDLFLESVRCQLKGDFRGDLTATDKALHIMVNYLNFRFPTLGKYTVRHTI